VTFITEKVLQQVTSITLSGITTSDFSYSEKADKRKNAIVIYQIIFNYSLLIVAIVIYKKKKI
jgi:hypothetical protein